MLDIFTLNRIRTVRIRKNKLLRVRYLDWEVWPNSKIERLPRVLQFPALLIRNITAPKNQMGYNEDGLITMHDLSILNTKEFVADYRESVKSSGRDFNIRYKIYVIKQIAHLALCQFKNQKVSVVELGCGRGFAMSAVLNMMQREGFENVPVILFDEFLSSSLIGTVRADKENSFYASGFESVRDNLARFKNISLVKGILPSALSRMPPDHKIPFLHIDLNSPEVEMACLELLWPQLPKGCYILVDDYGYFGFTRTKEIFDDFLLKSKNIGIEFPTGQLLIIKSHSA